MRLTTLRSDRPARRRAGFTMAETLVVLVLLAIVGGSLMGVLGKQQRFYKGTGDLIEMRTQMRQAAAILGNDLRGVSSVGNDILTMSDSSIDFEYTLGATVACSSPAAAAFSIPPSTALTNGNVLTSWIAKPGFGDTAYVFDEGSNTTSSADDAWRAYKVVSLATGSGTCDGTYNAGAAGYLLTLDQAPKNTVLTGAAIRFIRRAHYALYQSSNDRLWYLGYCATACDPTTNPISAIAGPFRPYVTTTSPDTSGIRFTYYDSTGTVTATPSQVARISVIVRGQTKGYLNIVGMARGYYNDSLRVNIALRNRS